MEQDHISGCYGYVYVVPNLGRESHNMSPDGGGLFRFDEQAGGREPFWSIDFDEDTVLSNSRERYGLEALVLDQSV
jgi:uncharacterized membrane protein